MSHRLLPQTYQRRHETLRRFGNELSYRRRRAGYRRAVDFAQELKPTGWKKPVTSQYLSQIENAYVAPGRNPVTPSHVLLSEISRVLNWPMHEIEAILGRIDASEAMGFVSVEQFKKSLSAMSKADKISVIASLLEC